MVKTILLVEDNRLNRKLVEAILSSQGYHLLMAHDGEEAIALAKAERPDLILMDMKLPKIDGYEATAQLKTEPETANIPVVAMTAHALPEEEEKATKAGCVGYITKPINTRTLPRQVKKYLS